MERREAQGRADAKYSSCICFDRVSLAASGHPLNIAINGVFVTDKAIPAQFIDRIYVLKDGSWETVGLMETQACRITGNEGGAPQFSRSPAQEEIEDQITRSNEIFDSWQSQMTVMEDQLKQVAQATTPDPETVSELKRISRALREKQPVVNDY